MGDGKLLFLGLIVIGTLLERRGVIRTVEPRGLQLFGAIGGLLEGLVISCLELLGRLVDRRDEARSQRSRLFGFGQCVLSCLEFFVDFSCRRSLQLLARIGMMR